MIELKALGSLAVVVDGAEASLGGPRQRRLLAMLLIHRQSVVSVDRLVDAVFAGEPSEAANTTMRSYVARMRKVIGDSEPNVGIVTQAPGYSLQAPADAVDIGRFEHLLADGQRQLAAGDAVVAVSSIRQALGVWNGDAFAEFADEEWAQPEAQRLEELRIAAQEHLVDAELACGHAVEVIAQLDALVAAHPLREAFHSQQMLALYRSGRQADALRAYREYRHYLIDEIGLEPSPALGELDRRILDHDPSLLLEVPAGEPLRGYRLGARLGTGPSGTVYWACLPGSDREYAVSILTDDRVDQADFVRRFDATAHQIASLRHPAVVPIHDHWRDPGAAYVVTRRIYGVTLRDRLRKGPMTIAEIDALVHRIGGALVEGEQRGVRHGWITLDNVVLDDAETAFLVNFVFCPETPCHDVADLAELIERCLHRVPANGATTDRQAITAVLARARSGGGLTMAEFVSDLTVAFAEGNVDAGRPRPNPFKGLRAFDESDADEFFGREGIIEHLLERLSSQDDRSRFTLVVGGSGSGKSSVVRAGLLPRVRRGEATGSRQWFVSTMLPGSAPFKELEESLRRVAVDDVDDVADDLARRRITLNEVLQRVVPGEGQLLLVIDQLEELFTLTSEVEQRAFLECVSDAVTAADSRLRVVATLRADFYDRPLAFQRFGASVGDATVAVSAMSPTDLEAAIVRPVEAIGASAEPALVAELIGAVVDQPAALPSLQFTLYELAERRADRCLTLADYRELGGVDAAIASRAETLYLSMDADGQRAARQLFEQLVVVGIDADPTSRRSARGDLSTGSSGYMVDAVIEQWTAARLLTIDNDPRTRVPTVQVAHEALLGTWPRLRQWIDDDREAIMALGHLRDAAVEWMESGRDDGVLYRGARLQNAVDFSEILTVELPANEGEFLGASVELRDREEHLAVEQTARQERANRRLRIQFAVIAVALVVALGVGLIAVQQQRMAQRERRVAIGRELAAASVANLGADPERSVLLALAAIDETRSGDGDALPEAEDALHQAVNASRIVLDVPGVGGTVDWSPTGEYFVTEGPEESGMIDLRDATTGESVRSWRGDDIDINDVVFNGDGSMLASAGDDGAVKVWDPATGDQIFAVPGDALPYWPSFDAAGSLLLTSWRNGRMTVADVPTGEVIASHFAADLVAASLSPDGSQIAVGLHEAPFAAVLDARSGDTIVTLGGHRGQVNSIAWSADGTRIATVSEDSTARIWDAESGESVAVSVGHKSGVNGVDWSPDGTRIATSGNDGSVRVWEVRDDAAVEVVRLAAQDLASGAAGVAFSPDGNRLLTSDLSITAAKVFDVSPTGGSELAAVPTPDPWSVAFTADGSGLLTSVDGGGVGVWNVGDGSRRSTIAEGVRSPRFGISPDGSTVVTGSADGFPLVLRDVATGAEIATIVRPGYFEAFAWSPDSHLFAVASGDADGSQVEVIDRDAVVQASMTVRDFWTPSLSFNRDGTTLAIPRRGRDRFDPALENVLLWDWQRDDVIRTIDQPVEGVAFDPTSDRLATSRFLEGTVDVWDSESGEHLDALVGHSGLISDLAFSSDGQTIATTSDDGTARIWNPATGEQLQVLRSGVGQYTVAFSPDGSRLATVDANGLAQVWALDLDELVDIARGRVTRSLSAAECRQYLHLDVCPTP